MKGEEPYNRSKEDCFDQHGDLTEVMSARLEALTQQNDVPKKYGSLVMESGRNLLLDDLEDEEEKKNDLDDMDEMLLEDDGDNLVTDEFDQEKLLNDMLDAEKNMEGEVDETKIKSTAATATGGFFKNKN